MAAREAESEAVIRQALTRVVHLVLNAKEGEGVALKEQYHVGPYYPVFILANSDGEVVNRWTGYTGAKQFLSQFRTALTNLTTIAERMVAFEQSPTVSEAVFLAKYHNDIAEFLQAAEYYRRAGKIGPSPRDYRYQVFENTVNAAWGDKITFNEVLPAADAVLASPASPENIVKGARLMARLARRKGTTEGIAKYLEAGLKISKGSRDEKMRRWHEDLRGDYALYVRHDTAAAITIKKASLGTGWSSNLDKYYPFGNWCFEHGINLEEAQSYVTTASERASEGAFKAKHLNLLAKICQARGLTVDAVYYAEQAVAQNPERESYADDLERFRTALGQ